MYKPRGLQRAALVFCLLFIAGLFLLSPVEVKAATGPGSYSPEIGDELPDDLSQAAPAPGEEAPKDQKKPEKKKEPKKKTQPAKNEEPKSKKKSEEKPKPKAKAKPKKKFNDKSKKPEKVEKSKPSKKKDDKNAVKKLKKNQEKKVEVKNKKSEPVKASKAKAKKKPVIKAAKPLPIKPKLEVKKTAKPEKAEPKQEPEDKDSDEPEEKGSGTDVTPWELRSSGDRTYDRGPSALEDLDSKPQAKPEPKPVVFEKKEGIIPNYSIVFRGQDFSFKDNPLAYIDGKVYICASDPDFKKLFESLGLTYSWFNFSRKLFVYLPSGSVNWVATEDHAKIGDYKVNVPTKARDHYGADYIPLDTLALLLDFQIVENKTAFELRPAVKLSAGPSKDENTIDIFMSSAASLKYDVKYQANPPAVRFTIPKAAYNGVTRKFYVEGVQVRVNNTLDNDKLYVTLEFPPHWKGRIIPTSYENQITIRMKPNLVYAWGMKDETLQAIEPISAGKQLYLQFKFSDYVEYYWSYDPDEGSLYVDVPFASPAPGVGLGNYKNDYIEKCTVSTYKPDGITITRLKMKLKPDAAFMIGPPENQKDPSFALLAGPRGSIPSPSARVGGSGVLIARLGSNLIVIDPGHGGSDAGAVNHKLGIKEKDLNLDISKKLAALLTKRGWKVILTRTYDTDLTYPGSPDADELQARADVANKRNAALFVSIHCNASTNKSRRGSSYHWYKKKDKPAALALKGSLGRNIGTYDKGIYRDQFYVLNHTKVPAVLVESAFVSNSTDGKLLKNSRVRTKIAQQLARSIDYFLRNRNLAGRPQSAEE